MLLVTWFGAALVGRRIEDLAYHLTVPEREMETRVHRKFTEP